jgi:hypothetical protein
LYAALFKARIDSAVLTVPCSSGLREMRAAGSVGVFERTFGDIGGPSMPMRHSSALTKAFGHDYLLRHETLQSKGHVLPVRCPSNCPFCCGYSGCLQLRR